jgi:hypothetical protein
VALGGSGEAEDGVDVEDSAPLPLEGSNKQGAPDTMAAHRLVRTTMQSAPAIRRGLVPLAGGDGVDAAAERATMSMVA